MTSAHTKAILEDSPIYLTGETIHIPVKSKRSYSHRIKVHKRRSIKPQLVKDELKFHLRKVNRLQSYVSWLLQPKYEPKGWRRFFPRYWKKASETAKTEWRTYEISRHNEIDKSFAQLKAEHTALAGDSPERRRLIESYTRKASEIAHEALEARGIKR